MKLKIFLLTILLTFSGCAYNGHSTPAFFQKGIANINDLKYSRALVNFKKSINTNPTHVKSYIKATNILLGKRQYKAAILLLQSGLKINAMNTELVLLMGDVQYKSRNFIKAETYYRKALELDSTNTDALIGLLHINALQNKFSKLNDMVHTYKDVIKTNQLEKFKLLINIEHQNLADSSLNFLKGRISEDEYSNFLHVISLKDDTTMNNMEKSKLIIDSKYPEYPELAIPYLDKVIKVNPLYVGGYLYKGIVYLKIGRYEDARISFLHGLKLDNTLPQLYINLAKANIYLKKYSEADKNFKSALHLERSEIILLDYYKFLTMIDSHHSMIDTINELITIAPNNAKYQILLATHECTQIKNSNDLDKQLALMPQTGINSEEKQTIQLLKTCLEYRKGELISATKDINAIDSSDQNMVLKYYIKALIAKGNDATKFKKLKDTIIDADMVGYYTIMVTHIND